MAAGDTVVAHGTMKMEPPITAHKAGTVSGLTAEVAQTLTAGTVLAEITSWAPTQSAASQRSDPYTPRRACTGHLPKGRRGA